MIGKTVVAIGSVLVATASAGCLSFYEIGVEIRPTSNLSLSLGVGYAQQPTGIDTGGFNSVPGATSFAFGRR